VLGDEMNFNNKKNNRCVIAASVATLFTLAFIVATSTMEAAPAVE
jgi:hypothetical protein